MDKQKNEKVTIETLNELLERFINLSLNDKGFDFNAWIKKVSEEVEGFCHEQMECGTTDCPGYKNDCGRCWLVAGTLCGGKVQGKFADKIESCTECRVFKDFIGGDPYKRQRELIFVLVHSLLLKTRELDEALAEIKDLSGMLPICAKCKNIRDDKGYWNQLESYLAEHSAIRFTHSLCHECVKELYPEIADKLGGEKDDENKS
ncbi:MAG: two-CW domain-containing protein [Desulfurivibrionaceae bacterium]